MKLYKFGITEVVVHINEKLNKELRESLSEKVSELDGIVSANVNDQNPHLMHVSYYPETAKTLQVLECVKNNGVHAQLAGWL
jgi:type III secretory pathway lipoprotein EscJ